jgi:hypothetical protein
LILETLNPSAVDAGDTGCVSSDEQGALTPVSDNFLGVDALQSIVSRSVITGEIIPTIPTTNQTKTTTGNLLAGNKTSTLTFAPNTTNTNTNTNTTTNTMSTNSGVNVGSATTNSANIISVPNAMGSGFQQRNFLNMFGPVPPDSLISFLGCQPCNNIGSF